MTGGVRPDLVLFCAAGLFFAQLWTGTGFEFAACVFFFNVVAAVAVGLLGGFGTLGGICVGVLALKMVTLSQIVKVVRNEAGEEHLDHPWVTMGVLLTGMSGVAVAALVAQLVRPRKVWFGVDLDPRYLAYATWVTLVMGMSSYAVGGILGGEEGAVRIGGLFGIARQFAFCLSLSIVFGTAHVLVTSGGRRLVGGMNLVPFLCLGGLGVVFSSKQGMAEPFVLVGLSAFAFGARFRWYHGVGFSVAAVVFVTVLFPFAQIARGIARNGDFTMTVEGTADLIQSFLFQRERWSEFGALAEEIKEKELHSYYDEPSLTLDRVSLIKPADLLVGATLREGESGWTTVTHGFKMLLPRKLLPSKPAIGTGNYLGQKAGMLAEDDLGTQISFGFIADSFSSFGWVGAFWIPLGLSLGFFVVFRKLVGPLWSNPWCIYLAAYFQHYFTEQSVASMILTVGQQPLILLATHVGLRLSWRYLAPWLPGGEVVGEGASEEPRRVAVSGAGPVA